MNHSILVTCYGDSEGQGRGLYLLDIEQLRLSIKPLHYSAAKPGGCIAVGNNLFLSEQSATGECGFSHLSYSSTDKSLTLQSEQSFPYVFSSFVALNQKQLLVSSFYDGVDALIDISPEIAIKQEYQHPFIHANSDDPRQQASHPHHVGVINANYLFSIDMGSDAIRLHYWDGERLESTDDAWISRPAGTGPRIMRITQNKKFAYLLNEISNQVSVYRLDFSQGKPVAEHIQDISTLASNVESSAAGIQLSADDKYLAVSNRGEDTVVLYAINSASGALTLFDRQSCVAIPRDILIHENYLLVAGQKANAIQLFEIQAQSRQLSEIGTLNNVPAPVGFTLL